MQKDFYVYAHYDSQGACKYIGKGRRNRAWTFCQRSKRWNDYFSDQKPNVKILQKELSELEAYEREAFYVSEMIKAGENLLNVAAGGYLNSWNDRAKDILSEMRRGDKHYNFGKKRSEETRAKISATKQADPERCSSHYWLGKKRDPEFMKKFIASAHTPEARAKQALTMTGRTLTEEHKQKIKAGVSGIIRTEEFGKAISEAKKGRPNGRLGCKFTEEHKKRISESRLKSQAVKDAGQKIWDTRKENGTASGYTTKKARMVLCKDTKETYRCAKEAAEKLSLCDKHIQACCAGRRKNHGGFSWSYI